MLISVTFASGEIGCINSDHIVSVLPTTTGYILKDKAGGSLALTEKQGREVLAQWR